MEIAETKSLHSWDWKHEQSDALQQVDPWARNAPKSVSSVKGCLSENFFVCSVCQKFGVYQHICQLHAPQYDISSEGEGRPDQVPIKVAPSDHSNVGEWWPDEVDLNTGTFSNMSIDSKPVETDGK